MISETFINQPGSVVVSSITVVITIDKHVTNFDQCFHSYVQEGKTSSDQENMEQFLPEKMEEPLPGKESEAHPRSFSFPQRVPMFSNGMPQPPMPPIPSFSSFSDFVSTCNNFNLLFLLRKSIYIKR